MTVEDSSLEELLLFIRDARGFDFTGYKPASVERRLHKRLVELDLERFDQYADYLELHADEFDALFDTLLINVTAFFRDPEVWRHLAETVIPRLVQTRPAPAPLRVWCAGCASGEEAYTVAMVLAEAIGLDAVRRRVKIYATDVDDAALDTARHGAFTAKQLEGVPEHLRERYFERRDQRYLFRKDLRGVVIFGRNNLIQDAPISRIDLLVCRNTLMYFTAETQAQVLRRFYFALAEAGALLLGRSEMLIAHSELFAPIDIKWRVYQKVARATMRDRVRVLAREPESGAPAGSGDLREAAFALGGAAQVVFDADRVLVLANVAARQLFGLTDEDLGRPMQDLQLSYRPIDLRSHLDSLAREARTIDIEAIRWPDGRTDGVYSVHIAPLIDGVTILGTAVTYRDDTELDAIRQELVTSRRELEQSSGELESTVEELETTNEELQSTNEELETTNEELQSTNEELETMNEELQSSNEELETINDELRQRTLELNGINGFLDTILSTVGVAVAVLDRDRKVQIWNREAREMWGLTADEVADHGWDSLDIGLPVRRLDAMINACLHGAVARDELELEAVNRRGRAFRCGITCLPLRDDEAAEIRGAIVMMEALVGDRPSG